MRHGITMPLVAAVLAFAPCPEAAADCEPTVEPLRLLVRLEEGSPAIERERHDTVVVFRADRINWSCDCPDGTEFTIDPPQLLMDLDLLATDEASWEEVREMLDAMAEAGEESRHPLFGDWNPGWTPGSGTIESPPLDSSEIDHGLWKFTWRIRLREDPSNEAVWDPHIFGHPNRRR